MKKSILILALIIAVAAVFTSCASSRGGCSMARGYVGYGASR